MQDQSMLIVAMGAIPRYLGSQYYDDWSLAQLNVVEDTSMVSELEGAESSAVARATKFEINEMSAELHRVQMKSIWLQEMLVAVENLSLCVSVASASSKVRGFPLIYINAAFEATTGYHRSEIIGQNCRFLQFNQLKAHVGESESISKISYALKEAKSIKIVLTNYRKDGSAFRNFLAMKPIMNEVCRIKETFM